MAAVSVFGVLAAASGCDLLNNSMVDYFENNTAVAAGTGYAVETGYIMQDAYTVIPAGEPGEIIVILRNIRAVPVAVSVSAGGSHAGSVPQAVMAGSNMVKISIPADTANGDRYDIILHMESADGLRDFEPYAIPPILCKTFHPITPYTPAGGAVTADRLRAPEGTPITLAAASNSGYFLGGNLKYDDGTVHSVTGNSFTMPDAPVVLSAGFYAFSAAGLTGLINDTVPANSTGTVTLPAGNIFLDTTITIGGNRDVTLAVPPGETAVLERDTGFTSGGMIDVTGGSSLTLGSGGSLVVDGGYDTTTGTGVAADTAAIVVGGTLTLEDGAAVRGNKNNTVAGGGGIFIGIGGSMTMNGGSIEYNEGVDGGGVAVQGTFEMHGGTIKYNKTVNNGVNYNPDGGGVLVDSGGSFIMYDGEIAWNDAERAGGGVHVFGVVAALFTMEGGKIHDNTSRGGFGGGGGGGVNVVDGSFTMNGGEIYSNTAVGWPGGGVAAGYGNTFFTMNGGSIYLNICDPGPPTGGGVYKNGVATVAGSGTTIYGNIPDDKNF
ncbi:MAG: hypothetical protein LBK08_02155 [Treponema sp.]|jgi:hypothetical protein|nr:hypothetical protein [Treponema sp.]